MSVSLPNVFSAFQAGRAQAAAGIAVTPSRGETAANPAPGGALELVGPLAVLERQPDGRMPFSTFSAQLAGDPVARLSQAVEMMKHGWLEFVGSVADDSDVRLTEAGRQVIETLNGAVAAA